MRFTLSVTEKRIAVFPVGKIARQANALARDLPFKFINPVQFPLFGNVFTRSNIVDVRIVGDGYPVIERLVNQIMDVGKGNQRSCLSLHGSCPCENLRSKFVWIWSEQLISAFKAKDIADAVEAAGEANGLHPSTT